MTSINNDNLIDVVYINGRFENELRLDIEGIDVFWRLIIHKSIVKIPNSYFPKCHKIVHLVIQEGIEMIGDYAFME